MKFQNTRFPFRDSLRAKSTLLHQNMQLEQKQTNTWIFINLLFTEHCQNFSFVAWDTLNESYLYVNFYVA